MNNAGTIFIIKIRTGSLDILVYLDSSAICCFLELSLILPEGLAFAAPNKFNEYQGQCNPVYNKVLVDLSAVSCICEI